MSGRKVGDIIKVLFSRCSITMFCLTFFLSGNFLFAQHVIVKGQATDSLNTPVPYIQISVEQEDKGSIVSFTSTDNEGNYLLKAPSSGKFRLVFRGLSVATKQISFSTDTVTYSTSINVQLKPKLESLDEVFLDTHKDIRMRKDTIIINPEIFKDGNEEVLEDLLGKLPGVTVESDGTIKVGNRNIEKVMVEGDDFFGRGYKLLTKNMDYEAVKEVEIYRNYSNNPLLKDIEESNKVALNLILKDEKKMDWFGNINGGYDFMDHRHLGRINLMSFGKANKFYVLSNFNNIGIDSKGDFDDLKETSTSGKISDLGDNIDPSSYFNHSWNVPFLKETRTRFNDSKLMSLNGILNLHDKFEVKILGFLEWDERTYVRNSLQEYFLQNASFENRESLKKVRDDFNSFGAIQAKYDFSNSKVLEFNTSYSQIRSKTKEAVLFNDEAFTDGFFRKNEFLNTELNYTQKINSSEVLNLAGIFKRFEYPQQYQTTRHTLDTLIEIAYQNSNLTQSIQQELNFAGVEANYFNRIDQSKLFEIELGFSNTYNVLISKIENVEEVKGKNLSNNFKYQNFLFYLKPKFTFNLDKITLSGGLGINKYLNSLEYDVTLEDKPYVLNPELGIKWNLGGSNMITGSYYQNSKPLKSRDILPNYYLNSYRSLQRGVGQPQQLRESGIYITHSLGNWGDRYFINTLLSYTKKKDFLSTVATIDPALEIFQHAVFNDQEFLNLSTNLDFFLKSLNSNLKMKGGYSISNYPKVVNNEPLYAEAEDFRYGVEFKTAFLSHFNFHLGSEWNTSYIDASGRFKSTRNMSFLDMIYVANDKLNISVQAERYSYRSQNHRSDGMYFIDVNLRYSFLKNKLSLQLHGQNLLNTTTFQDYFITDLSMSSFDYEILPRLLMLKINYRF